MANNSEKEVTKQVPRPEIKYKGKNTSLTYHVGSFYELYLAVSQINELLSNLGSGKDSFTIKRDIKIEGLDDKDAGIGIILRFTIPRRINDMSLIGTAINSSQSLSK